MKKLLIYFLTAVMFFAVGCTERYDDSLIWEKLYDHENRITKLEELCKQMNTNISSLQTVVNALQNNDYVTNIAPITEDGKVVGYVITFSKSGAVTIYHGKDGKDGANGADGTDGKDGYTPMIGVAKDSDGIYYWTLDGDWLLNKDGDKVKAEGVDGTNGGNGANGKDGITPKLKIKNGYWYISYNNGTTWTELGKATGENGANGEDGDSMFKEVTYDDDYVYITLIDGSKIVIPRVPPIPNNEIWYTSNEENIITPYKTDVFGANIISNAYENGKGIIKFDGTVTSIGDEAFRQLSSLTSITIPDGVTSIGDEAFAICRSLTRVTIPESVTSIGYNAFSICPSLKDITIPRDVTLIGDSAFSFCSSLTSITIPDGVESIGVEVFHTCSSLSTITIPDSVTSIGAGAFAYCTSLTEFTIPNSVTSIGNGAFSGCSSLTSITIPDSVTSIGDAAFSSCTSLTAFTIPNNVTSIGYSFFSGCSSLTEIMIPNNVTSIGSYAFNGCSSLTEIMIPNSVTSIGGHAFNGCSSLTEITIPDSVIAIEERNPFANCINLYKFNSKYASEDNRCLIINGEIIAFASANITSYAIPDCVTSIGNSAFNGCSSLTSIDIPESVISIGDAAFNYCSSLSKVSILGHNVTLEGYGLFCYCTSLKEFESEYASEDGRCLIVDGVLRAFAPQGLIKYSIPDNVTKVERWSISSEELEELVIPSSVTEIASSPFGYSDTSDFRNVYCKNAIPPTLGGNSYNTFYFIKEKIYVPIASVDAYKTAEGWKQFADKIEGYNFE